MVYKHQLTALGISRRSRSLLLAGLVSAIRVDVLGDQTQRQAQGIFCRHYIAPLYETSTDLVLTRSYARLQGMPKLW